MTFRKRPRSIRPRQAVQPEAQAGSDVTASRSSPPDQLDGTLWHTAERDVTGSRRASESPHPGTAPAAGDGRTPEAGPSRPSGSKGVADASADTDGGPDPDPEGGSGSQGAGAGRADPFPAPDGRGSKSYHVDINSVFQDLMGGEREWFADFDDFESAREHLIEKLESGIVELQLLHDELKRAEDFLDLDLGWHEPLLQEFDDAEE